MITVAHLALLTLTAQTATIGTGATDKPAIGRAPEYKKSIGSGYVLVKNWDFGAKGTIKNINDMTREFVYRDQFMTIANGTNYGAVTVAPNAEVAMRETATGPQPVEDPKNPVRTFTADSVKTFVVALNGAASVSPKEHNTGCGSFMAKWALAKGGSLLGKDILWETRIRMDTPPYYWFALWNAGQEWDKGAEIDLVEGFGYDNGGGNTNYDARYWHSDSVGGTNEIHYGNWGKAMAEQGIPTYDAKKYHVWQLLYRKDNSYSCYVDGIEVQKGKIHWTLKGTPEGKPLEFFFLFDAGWGHNQVQSVNHTVDPAIFKGKYYEWDYSRVYLRS